MAAELNKLAKERDENSQERRALKLAERLRPFLGSLEDNFRLMNLHRYRSEIKRPKADEPFPEWIRKLQEASPSERNLISRTFFEARKAYGKVGNLRRSTTEQHRQIPTIGISGATLLYNAFRPLTPNNHS
jgi:hypothetical protein